MDLKAPSDGLLARSRTQPSPQPRSDRRRAVERALASLGLAQREAVCLCLLAGKTTAEVASILGTSRTQVARLVSQGLSQIARERGASVPEPRAIPIQP